MSNSSVIIWPLTSGVQVFRDGYTQKVITTEGRTRFLIGTYDAFVRFMTENQYQMPVWDNNQGYEGGNHGLVDEPYWNKLVQCFAPTQPPTSQPTTDSSIRPQPTPKPTTDSSTRPHMSLHATLLLLASLLIVM